MLDQGDKPLILKEFVLMKKIMSKNQGNCLDVHLVDLFKFFCASFFFSFDASMCNRSNNVIHNMWKNDILGSYLIKYSRLHFIILQAESLLWNLLPSILKNWNGATQKVHLGEKEEKATSAGKKLLITMLKTFDSFLN